MFLALVNNLPAKAISIPAKAGIYMYGERSPTPIARISPVVPAKAEGTLLR
ncbi:MAG: hypothetical protein WAK43_04245 [Dehalococcoidales bacterium]